MIESPRAGVRAAVAKVLATLTCAACATLRHGAWFQFDDPLYVFENRHVLRGLSLESIASAFQTGHAGNWHPLTWLSHMLDVELSGASPGRHHLMNVALNAANSVLLLHVLHGMTKAFWPSAFAAALFALERSPPSRAFRCRCERATWCSLTCATSRRRSGPSISRPTIPRIARSPSCRRSARSCCSSS